MRDLIGYFSLAQLPGPRAVVDITFALNYRFGKLDPFGYHLVNVLIHTINGFLVYFLALAILKLLYWPSRAVEEAQSSKLKGKRGKLKGKSSKLKAQSSKREVDSYSYHNSQLSLMALFAALIFVVHPIQTQAVTYTSQRYASMAAMFYMGAVLFYLKARIIQRGLESKGQRAKKTPGAMAAPVTEQASQSALRLRFSAYFVLSVFCGMLALFSKQNTASLPGAILLVEYLFIDRTWQGWKKKIRWIAPIIVFFVIIVLYMSGLTRGGVHFGSLLEDVSDLMRETKEVSRWSYLCTQFNVLIIYLRLLLLPVSQNLDYVYPFKAGFFDGYTPLAFLALVGLAVTGIWLRKSRPLITFAIFWFFITLSVESSIIPIRDAMFEHRLYLPMFGFALLVSCLLFHLLSGNFHGLLAATKRENPPLPPFDKWWIGGFSYKQLWAVIISVFIIISLGMATYLRNKVWRDAETFWSDVVSKAPLSIRGHNNLGNALAQQERFKEAVNHFSEALRIKPDHAGAHLNLGAALMQQGRLKEAVKQYSEALRIKPRDAGTHNVLGVALAKAGRVEEAMEHYHEALRINPDFSAVYYNIACLYATQSRTEESINWLRKAVERGYKNWNLLKTDKDLDNIRGSAYYKKLSAGRQGTTLNN
jgi:tetratricopeptide (TPR) repeat protein